MIKGSNDPTKACKQLVFSSRNHRQQQTWACLRVSRNHWLLLRQCAFCSRRDSMAGSHLRDRHSSSARKFSRSTFRASIGLLAVVIMQSVGCSGTAWMVHAGMESPN